MWTLGRSYVHKESGLDMKSRQEKWKIRMEEMSMERTAKKIFEGKMVGKGREEDQD